MILKNKNLAIFDNDNALICREGPKENAKYSCNNSHQINEIAEEVVYLCETLRTRNTFEKDVQEGGVNIVSWEDISEATDNDRKLRTIRNAFRNNDMETVRKEITGIRISDN